MLSICIPIYDAEVVVLVTELLRQAQRLSVDFEILVWEDGSQEKHKRSNRTLADLDPRLQYVEWQQNRGRSVIRNRLAQAAQYRYLLFLDCDAKLPDDQFLARYQAAWQGELDLQVICGGRVYPDRPAEGSLQLHWLYGTHKESRSVERRQRAPTASFMTNNFLLSRSIFEQLSFHEALKGYGHEDTLFGWELQKKGIRVSHIDNPVVHIGLETATVFLQKTVQGVINLYRLYAMLGTREDWYKDIKIMRFFLRLKSWRLAGVVYRMISTFYPQLERQLLSSQPSLTIFNLYKLYHLLRQDRLA